MPCRDICVGVRMSHGGFEGYAPYVLPVASPPGFNSVGWGVSGSTSVVAAAVVARWWLEWWS